jgi:hypothetical protein
MELRHPPIYIFSHRLLKKNTNAVTRGGRAAMMAVRLSD